ncbi:MAG: MFS transporter [bacterium]|nr:MFS transporter [bacterium]
MRKYNYAGAMNNVWMMLIGGMFFLEFGTTIGMSNFQWGLLTGISSCLMPTQIISAIIAQRTGKRKIIWFSLAIGERGLKLTGILLALWFWRAGWPGASIVLIGTVCISNLLGTMANPPWMSWMADVIPEDHHGTFWGRRTAWIALSVIATTVPAAFLIDKVPDDQKVNTMLGVFVFATIIGLLDLLIHGTIPEPPPETPEPQKFLHEILKPIRDHKFRPWLVFHTCWSFGLYLGGSLCVLYFLKGLGLSKNLLGGTLAITCLGFAGGLTGGWSGKLVDRHGVKRVLFWGHLTWAFLPVVWLIARPENALYWLGAGSLISGVACSAAGTAANKLITRVPPPELRAVYVAVSNSAGSLAGGCGAITAGTIMYAFGESTITSPIGIIGGFQVLFLISLCLRISTTVLFIPRLRVQETDQ